MRQQLSFQLCIPELPCSHSCLRFPAFPALLLASNSHRIPAPKVRVCDRCCFPRRAGLGRVSLALGKTKVAPLPSWPVCLGGSRPQPPLAVKIGEGLTCPTLVPRPARDKGLSPELHLPGDVTRGNGAPGFGAMGRRGGCGGSAGAEEGDKDANGRVVSAPEPVGWGVGTMAQAGHECGPWNPRDWRSGPLGAVSPARPRALERSAVLSGWLRWKHVLVHHGPEETTGDCREPRGGNRRTRSPDSAPAEPARRRRLAALPAGCALSPLSAPLHRLWFGQSLG